MQNPFGAGRLDETYLEQDDPGGDPWALETRQPQDAGHRDAFLGNGWMGQRFGVEGDASAYLTDEASLPIGAAPSGCLIHGFWDDLNLMAPPHWASLGYHDGQATFARGVGVWSDYRQALDLRTGTLTTEVCWNSGSRVSRILRRAWLSRSRPNVAVIEIEVTPQFDGEICFTDRLDGRSAADAAQWRALGAPDPVHTISLDARFGPRGRWLALHSRLLVLQPACEESPEKQIRSHWFLNDLFYPADITITAGERWVERVLKLPARAGQTVRVVKIVAIASDAEAPGPWLAAWNLAESAAGDLAGLRAEHEAAWARLWEHWIEASHPALQRLLNASLYQLYANLRAGSPWIPGPTGLSSNAWNGHVFWDDDLWMFPGVCLLQPELGRCFVEYRCRTLPGALRNAASEGYAGAMIAWESAEFGDDTIPHLIFHHQHHVNSEAALAQRWYTLISGDEAFLREQGLPVILDSARFWASRAVFNEAQGRYEIRRVATADEFAGIRDNSASTNYSAAWTLRLAARLARRYGLACPPEWETIADRLWIPYDEPNQRYFEYEGYAGEVVKQADTALLIYPYEMPMPEAVKANTLDYYRTRYPDAAIMMSAAFDGIVDCELGRAERAWDSFLRLLPHFRQPYLLASESPLNETISFLTGLGGLLQLALMGFAGIRIHEEGLLVQPCLPAQIGRLAIHGLHYRGVSFDLILQDGQASVANPSAPITFPIYDRQGNRFPLPG